MNEQSLALVTFEQAMALRRLGFEYRIESHGFRKHSSYQPVMPPVSLALEWFRIEKKAIAFVYYIINILYKCG